MNNVLTGFASNFTPMVMRLSAAGLIRYDFDGSLLEIPLTVSGKPGTLFFLVFTRNQAEKIESVQNGYLGWHYVNQIDTCIYMSPPTYTTIGTNLIEWNGKSSDGSMVPAGNYTYYMWAYDHVDFKIPASKCIDWASVKGGQIELFDEQGQPLANPVIFPVCYKTGRKATDLPVELHQKKWVLGGDPEDSTLVETTSLMGGNHGGYIAFRPDDRKTFFFTHSLDYPHMGAIHCRKYQWVPNGGAIQDMSWGDNGEYIFKTDLAWPHWETGVITDRQGTLYQCNEDISGLGTESELIYIDMDIGEELRRVDLSHWWIDPDDSKKGGQIGGGPTTIIYNDGYLFASSHTSCIKTMMDPFREDDTEVHKWVNQNGDYIGDHNFEADSVRPWVCNDDTATPYMYTTSADALQFSIFVTNLMGSLSFGLIAPDGTGIGYLSFAGETDGSKFGQIFLDTGSAFDGIYTDNNSTPASKESRGGWWYVSHDSIKGVLTNSPISVDETPAAFTVTQNSPNPFNASTAIEFTIPENAHVKIDIYNIAGQKVDTIMNGFLSAGSYSVNWNADGFSDGLYVCRVNANEFSRTLKMTLLK